jgi:hypothetical protein
VLTEVYPDAGDAKSNQDSRSSQYAYYTSTPRIGGGLPAVDVKQETQHFNAAEAASDVIYTPTAGEQWLNASFSSSTSCR